jgi:tetratricopeptide (TPR) repeat protein
LPNESEVYLAIGAIQRRQGKWAESTANLEKAASLNPKDTWPLQNLASIIRCSEISTLRTRRWIARSNESNGIGLWEIKVKLAIAEKGDFSVYEQAWRKGKSLPMSSEERLKIVGAQAIFSCFNASTSSFATGREFPDDSLAPIPGSLAVKYFAIGIAQKGLGDDAAARSAFLKAKNILEEQLKQKPDDPDLHVQLSETAGVAW